MRLDAYLFDQYSIALINENEMKNICWFTFVKYLITIGVVGIGFFLIFTNIHLTTIEASRGAAAPSVTVKQTGSRLIPTRGDEIFT